LVKFSLWMGVVPPVNPRSDQISVTMTLTFDLQGYFSYFWQENYHITWTLLVRLWCTVMWPIVRCISRKKWSFILSLIS